MTPVTRKVRVKVPATSANLGSGFDTVGLALDYHDELEFTLSADPVNTAAQVMIEGEGEDTLPRDETHLVVSTFRRACQTFGLGRVGFILQAHNNIPQARGMGSSAEAIVAGIAAAAAFAQDDDLNRDAVFELAAAIEGHPDNRYTPTNAYGKRESHNIYAKTREECEEKLAEMIAEVKAQIKAEKEKMTG